MATFGNFAKRKVADKVVAGKGVANDASLDPSQAPRPVGVPDDAAGLPAADGALPDDLVEVGVIVDSYGVKGWVKIQPHAQDGHGGDAMVRARRWWLAARLPMVGRPAGGTAGWRDEPRAPLKAVDVAQAKTHSGSVVAHLAGFADRDQALAAKGTTVHVRRADFPTLSKDEFYWVDLIGLAVINTEGEALGEVVGLIDNGAQSVMRIAPAGQTGDVQPDTPSEDGAGPRVREDDASAGPLKASQAAKDRKPVVAADERLIPFVDAYVQDVDFEARRIVVDWGLDY